MKEQSITFFPVGNGDTSLIRLDDGTTIIIDCHILDDGIYDVTSQLLEILDYKDEIPHTNVFVLTHPHDDHIHGFQNAFYVGDPTKYSKKDKEKSLIVIDELWFAPRIFIEDDDDITEDANAFKKEAERRVDLYRNNNEDRLLQGNRLRLIGATDNLESSLLDDICTIPGQTLSLNDNVRFFVFAPVKKDTDEDQIGLNNTSIVFQARFDVDGEKEAVRVFFGGDAESPIWQRIVKRNDDENLTWDLLEAPHHCSWSFFNDSGDDALEEIQHLLELKRGNAVVVASSKPIKNNDDNPPSYKAKQHYTRRVGADNFLCTGEKPTEEKPEPIYFIMSKGGLTKSKFSTSNRKATIAVISSATSTPRTYG